MLEMIELRGMILACRWPFSIKRETLYKPWPLSCVAKGGENHSTYARCCGGVVTEGRKTLAVCWFGIWKMTRACAIR